MSKKPPPHPGNHIHYVRNEELPTYACATRENIGENAAWWTHTAVVVVAVDDVLGGEAADGFGLARQCVHGRAAAGAANLLALDAVAVLERLRGGKRPARATPTYTYPVRSPTWINTSFIMHFRTEGERQDERERERRWRRRGLGEVIQYRTLVADGPN